MGDKPRVNLVRLREILLERAVSDDLRIFCADLNVNYESVVGPNDKLPIAIINLITYLGNRDRLDELIARAKKEFPNAPWAEIYASSPAVPPAAETASAKAEALRADESIAARRPGPLRVFLCHASDDKPAVRELYAKLRASGVQPWLDEEDLLPGQKWKVEIPKAIRASDVILVCLSQRSVKKDGYVKREIEFALDIADKLAEDAIFIIPLRLEECDFPDRVGDWHGVNLYAPGGYERLLRALQVRASAVGAELNAQIEQVIVEPSQGSGAERTPREGSTASADALLIELPKLGFRLELVRVPAGEFLMGSDKAKDKAAQVDEIPQHWVYLDEYLIGKYPVTVAQFAAFVKATGYETTAEREGSAFVYTGSTWDYVKGANWYRPRGPKSDVTQKQNHPVTCVSWDDAAAFCKWLSEASGRDVRLPSEAQWEKAARWDEHRRHARLWPWSDDPPMARHCNFAMNVKDTTPVGDYSPLGDSPYGCADMAGNVWEWCADWYDEKEYERRAGKEVRNPTGPSQGTYRVLRGGAFLNLISSDGVRCALRGRVVPNSRIVNFGFRVCALPIRL
ncbi:MAG: SUMF1/EgtB/PvdO family nonheme iron enzyme [Anaerolineae bacterium]|nr:SUMF1/EgtB/PvdO family nonheme iron enzyme [Candidatus Roseilinea sp.]MDW8450246.1 SUMF1/EgtB/PvdO family nonheme iron enzyme [Anaerolineae bacterium]